MRDAAAIVAPATDIAHLAREIAKEHIALQDCERQLDAAERKSEGLRQEQARRRVEIGRMLVEAKRAIKHGGWLPYLEKLGIDRQRANEWMRLAGYIEEQEKCPPRTDGGHLHVPTLAESGARPRKSTARADEQPDPPPRAEPTHVEPKPVPTLDIDAELSRIQNKICTFAESVPPKARKLIAHELRETAKLIEEMP